MGLSTDPTIRFRAFGTAALEGPDGVDSRSVLSRAKLVALLSFLAGATPRGFHRRDTLLGLFWADLDQERARGALRQSLYYLRQFLGDGVVATRGDDEVGLAADLFWSDVAAFDAAVARGALEEALAYYAGDLLRGFYLPGAPEFERWLEERRVELRRRACDAAWDLAQQATAAGSNPAAARWAREAVRFDPLDEAMVRRAIELMDRIGDRAGAVREYETFAQRLHRELDVEPAPETRQLVDAVRARTMAADAVPSPAQPVELSPGPNPVSVVPGPSREPFPRSRRGRLGLTVGALVVLVAAVWAVVGRVNDGRDLDPNHIVVAVFENRTGDPTLDPVGRMAADWITQGLDQLDVIDVVPSATGFTSRADFRAEGGGGSGDPRTLAETTGAGTVIAGSFYLSADSLRFQTQIVDARNGALLSAVAPVGGPQDAASAIVDTLRQFVVGTMVRVFDSRMSAPVPGVRPPTLAAYRAFLAGYRAFYNDAPSFDEARTFFQRAVELDSSFLDPRLYLVFTYANLGEFDAADSVAQILALHRPQLTEIQTRMLDWQLALLRGDRVGALQAARLTGSILNIGAAAQEANHLRESAAALNDVDDLAEWPFHWMRLMEVYHMLGEYGRELRESERARAALPDRTAMVDATLRALSALGRIEDLTRLLDETLPLLPDAGRSNGFTLATTAAELRAHGHRSASFEIADRALRWYRSRSPAEAGSGFHRFALAMTLYQLERWEEAATVFEDLATEGPDNVDVLGFLGVLAARRGDRDAATRLGERLTGVAARGDFGREAYWRACIAAQLGDRDRATQLLQDAYAQGRMFTIWLHRDMDLEPLRGYRPFEQFVASRD